MKEGVVMEVKNPDAMPKLELLHLGHHLEKLQSRPLRHLTLWRFPTFSGYLSGTHILLTYNPNLSP